MQQLPGPLGFGYIIDSESGLLVPQLMNQSLTPPELLGGLVCDCTDMCEIDCKCLLNEQPCTQAYDCKAEIEDIDVCMNLFTT